MKIKDLSKLAEKNRQEKQLKTIQAIEKLMEEWDIAEQLALLLNLQAKMHRDVLRELDKFR